MESQTVQAQAEQTSPMRRSQAYAKWLKDEGVKVYEDYFIEDTRTLELGHWARRDCSAAFLKLIGQEGISEAHVIELAPGQSLPPFHIGVEELIYGIEGMGITTLWANDQTPKRSFEWGKHSMFYIPPNYTYQLSNASGVHPARLLIYSSLPLVFTITPDPNLFFNNPYADPELVYGPEGAELYGDAKAIRQEVRIPNRTETTTRNTWSGFFFADMLAWDRLDPFYGRGAGGHVVGVRFPTAGANAHMSVFDSKTYKKAHSHAGGVGIIIPGGEGFSIIWPEGGEKIIIPWHESSVFVPPNDWFHQHFNVGDSPARYLAMHPPVQNLIQELSRGTVQIEYADEEPFIRQYFAEQLAKRGLESLMPEECYTDRNFEWEYGDSGD